MDAPASERKKQSAVVAIVGEEVFGPALVRSLRARGMTPVEIGIEELAKKPPPHALALFIGEPALDGGEAASALLPKGHAPIAVVLRDVALAERLSAHRRGVRVVLRKESADAMAADVEKMLDPSGAAELGWTSLASILDLLTRSIGARLSVDASARTELLLGDPSAVAEAIERCADELGMLALESRAGQAGPTVAVDELNWDDDPQTAQQSAAEMNRWRKLASKPPPEPSGSSLRFLRPPQKPARTFEPLSAPATNLAEILEPDSQQASGVVPNVVPITKSEDEITVPGAAPLPMVLRPERAEPPPVAVVAAPAPKKGASWIAIAIGLVLGAGALVGVVAAGVLMLMRPVESPIARSTRAPAPAPIAEPPPAQPVPEPSVEQAPPPPSNESADELVDRGMANERVNAWDAARIAYEQAIAIEPNNPHALAGLARERIQAGDAESAIRFAERAVSTRRRRASYRVLLGDAHRLAGDTARAHTEYEAALEIDPENAEARARMAQ